MQGPTSGTALLDTLIDGVRIGDNLVFVGDATAPLDTVVARFVAAADDHTPLVVVTFDPATAPTAGGRATVVDWSPAVTGTASSLPDSIGPEDGVEAALASLRSVDDRVGTGAAFVFDRLSTVQELWGADAALELFLSTCPRLYRRRSLAVWPVEQARHRPAFLRRLEEITQVVVELGDADGRLALTVRKADGRPAEVVGRCVHAELVEGDLRALDDPSSTRERLGTVIRDQRRARGLSQADVARRVGISPSALSQVERGVRGPSGDTLVRLWEVLGVAFGPPSRDAGYTVARRSARDRRQLQDGMTGEQVLADEDAGSVWLLEIAPGASGDRGPFAVKSPELVTVVRGVLELHLDGRAETLHEGDALVAARASVTAWGNPAPTPTEVLWSWR